MTSSVLRRIAGLVSAMGLLVASASSARAQESPWSFGVQLGAAVPTGALADLEDPGPSLDAGAAYALSSRLGVTLGGGLDVLLAEDEPDTGIPDLRLWHYTAGLEALVTPARAGWSLRAGAAAGATYAESDAYPRSGTSIPTTEELGETYPSVTASLRAGWRPSDRLDLLAGVGTRVVFFDETETAPLAALAVPGEPDVEGFGAAATVPLYLRLRIRL